MKVVIVGRTNVGKSSLFNRLIKKRKSLVINESGITRDLLKDRTTWWGCDFELVDSGGFPEWGAKDELSIKILEKIKVAIQQADIFLVIVDGKAGLRFEDSQVMKIVRKTGKPFVLFVNKIDRPDQTDLLVAPFFELNPDLLSGSFENNYGVYEIVEWIIAEKKKKGSFFKEISKDQQVTKLFVIGKANSGKSLLCNQILNTDRMIVSSQPGTTLDTVTDFFSHNKEEYSISDNPGARRGNREEREKISFAKSRSELKESDIVLLVLDIQLGPSRQEARLVRLCLDQKKPVILLANKMDLIKKLSPEDRKRKIEEIEKIFHFYLDLPIVFISAKTGYHKHRLFEMIESIKQKIQFRVSTSELNNFFTKIIRKAPAPVYGTSDVKFYYINQTHRQPPEFIAFANYPKGVTPAYNRFIVNKIKQKWDLKGIPISFHALEKR